MVHCVALEEAAKPSTVVEEANEVHHSRTATASIKWSERQICHLGTPLLVLKLGEQLGFFVLALSRPCKIEVFRTRDGRLAGVNVVQRAQRRRKDQKVALLRQACRSAIEAGVVSLMGD